MSMQRSFLALVALSFLHSVNVKPFFFDDLNGFVLEELFSYKESGSANTPPHSFPPQKDPSDEGPEDKDDKNQNKKNRSKKQPQEQTAKPRPEKSIILKDQDIRFNDIVGQEQAVAHLRAIVSQFQNPARLRLLGGEHKKGILLEGPPGTGKTMLARAIANELGYSFHECPASSFVEVFVGTGAQRVRELFNNAHATAPAIIFMDEIDAIAVKRGEDTSGGNQEYRQTTLELLTQMNKINHSSNVLVIAATNCIEHVDEAFKAPHRFDVVTIGLPDEKGRAATLRNYLNRLPRTDVNESVVAEVAEKTKGFSQSQLKSVINGAVQLAVVDKSAQSVTGMHVLLSLEQARNAMKNSIFGSRKQEYDKLSFEDIGGMEEVINEFKFLVHTLKNPDALKSFGVDLPKGILLVGQPGCGKTMLVRALANEAHCQVISVSGGNFDTKFMGDGAKELGKLFASAALVSPCIIFIDECDGITSPQSINKLLTEMDGFVKENNVIVIGATNHLEAVDYRLRREGRFSRIVPIELPDEKQRRRILELYINKLPKVDHAQVPYDMLVNYTQNFSGAGLKNIVNDAAMQACVENAPMVHQQHFMVALERALMARQQRGQD